jgi:phospholipase/lecithinase/hemolysin
MQRIKNLKNDFTLLKAHLSSKHVQGDTMSDIKTRQPPKPSVIGAEVGRMGSLKIPRTSAGRTQLAKALFAAKREIRPTTSTIGK